MATTHDERVRELVNLGLSPQAAEEMVSTSTNAPNGGSLADGEDVVLAAGSGDQARTLGASITLKGGGSDGVNEIQTITEGGTISGGTWDLTIPDASVALVDIPWNVTAAQLQALIDSDDIAVTGGPVATTPFSIEYIGSLARGNRDELTVDDANLTGSTPSLIVATDTAGTAGTDGGIIVVGLPTSDPQVAGQLWSNSGVLTVSAG